MYIKTKQEEAILYYHSSSLARLLGNNQLLMGHLPTSGREISEGSRDTCTGFVCGNFPNRGLATLETSKRQDLLAYRSNFFHVACKF
jgi:hypothetical protein